MKKNILIALLVMLTGLSIAQTYTESPAEGSFSSDASLGGEYDYKAGEFTIEAEGVLPPTNEELRIVGAGTKGEIKKPLSRQDNNRMSSLCTDPIGVDLEVYTQLKNPDNGELTCYDESGIYNIGGNFMYNPKLVGLYKVQVEARVAGYTGCEVVSSSWNEEEEQLEYFYDDGQGSGRFSSVDQSISATGESVECSGTGRVQSATRTDSLDFNHTTFYGPDDLAKASGNADQWNERNGAVWFYRWWFRYIDPVGATHVDVNGDKFTGKVKTVNDYSDDVTSGSWRDTGRSFSIDLSGEYDSVSLDDTKMVFLSGKYKANSPPGVTPESYRWVKVSDGTVLANYTGFDSGTSKDYMERSSSFNADNGEISSGTYKLQVKSSAGYPVGMGVKDFKAKADEFIQVGDSRTFNPQLDLGSNQVQVFTSNANNLRYSYSWNECHAPASGVSPSDGAVVPTLSPELRVTNNCNSIDNITFRDAGTDNVLGEFQDVSNGQTVSKEVDLSIGETYRWYIRFCDQGQCYDTDTYEFTVGQRDPGSGGVGVEESTSRGLEHETRDEDFNAFGQPQQEGETLSGNGQLGYINKLEEESDQLEPGMATTSFGMNDPGSPNQVSIWSNSQGGKDSADQWAIAPKPEWAISNRGNPYPPWGTYYRDSGNSRSTTNSPTVRKTSKVFGNSLAVVAQTDVTDGDGNLIAREGTGVWIDPDDIGWTKEGEKYEYTGGSWEDLLDFNMDITGPDSGIGYDAGDGASVTPLGDSDDPSHRSVLKADIYYKGENN